MSVNKQQSINPQPQNQPFFVDLNTASPETVKSILRAMIAEMEEAMTLKRFATFERAFARLSPSTVTMI